jgi:iron complex outermembrane receptor protein
VSVRVRTELSNAGTAGSKSGNQVMQGVVNLPLASNAAIRIAGFGNLRQGPDYNLTSGKYTANDTWGTRGHLLWQPTERLTVNLIGDYTQSRVTNGGDFFTFVKANGAAAFPLAAGVPDNVSANLASCGITAAEGNRNFCTSANYVDHTYSGGASLQVDYQADPFTITSISAYRKSLESGSAAATSVFRADPLLLQVANGDVHRPIDLFTQELRISSPSGQTVEYTGGLFYSNQIQSRTPEPLTVSIHPAPGVFIPVASGGTGPSASPTPRWRSMASHHPCQRQAAPDRGRALHLGRAEAGHLGGQCGRFAQQPHRARCEPLLVEGGRAI